MGLSVGTFGLGAVRVKGGSTETKASGARMWPELLVHLSA